MYNIILYIISNNISYHVSYHIYYMIWYIWSVICHGWVVSLSHDSGRQRQTWVKPEAVITV